MRTKFLVSKSLNARHLEIFLSLMTSENLADAAYKLSISQPAVSKTIRFLERETGVLLFVRVKGRLRPTPAAEQLLPYAQRTLGPLNAARRVASSLRGGLAGQVVLAAAAPPLVSLIPLAVQRFAISHPSVKVEIRGESSTKVAELVSNHEADIGISATPVQAVDARFLQKCQTRRICEHELVIVCPKKHRLARWTFVRPADLRDESIIALPDDSPTMVLVGAAFQQANVPMKSSVIANNSIGVCALVREGLGIGLINPMQLAHTMFPDLVARPFRPRTMLRTFVYFSSYQPLSHPASELVKCIERAAKEYVTAAT